MADGVGDVGGDPLPLPLLITNVKTETDVGEYKTPTHTARAARTDSGC